MKRLVLVLAIVLTLLVACGDDDSGGDAGGKTVTLITHSSFLVSDEVLAAFEQRSGIKVNVLRGQDAGAVVNQAILTKDNPEGDVLYGIDNTLLSRGLDAELFDPYQAEADIDPELDLDDAVTPVDYSDVCVNYDKTAFGAGNADPPPRTLDDLKAPQYASRLVVENAATSSPGLAFLLATVVRYGEDGYLDFWKALRAGGVKVVEGWEQAYNDTFTLGASGTGDRPLVVSYATSPPADVVFADPPKDTTDIGTLTDGCFRQIEFAGVLNGTKNRDAARQVVDFLVSTEVQADIPLQMFVFPAVKGTPLPEVFTKFAATVPEPLSLPADEIAAKRDQWIKAWTDAVVR